MMKKYLASFVMVCAAHAACAQTLADTAVTTAVVGQVTAAPVAAVPASAAPQETDVVDAAVAPAAVPVASAESQQPVFTPQPPSVIAVVEQNDKKMTSLFFTPNQLASIMRANQGFIAPQEAYDPNNQSAKPMDAGPREIKLAGIVYNNPNDWTIWLNGEKVTPKNVPDRIMGINVKKDRVQVRWMDVGNQRIVNITLRANEMYLLDSDTIVPGGGV